MTVPTTDLRRTQASSPEELHKGLDGVLSGLVGRYHRNPWFAISLRKQAERISDTANGFRNVSDRRLRENLNEMQVQFRRRMEGCAEMLPDVLAMLVEVADRTIGLRCYPVQAMGAMALNLLGVAMTSDNKTKGRMNAAIGLLMTSYSRKDEEMADKLSVRYVKKAGYDPKAILKTMDKMIKMQREMPIRVYSAYQSHPYYSERKAALKKEVYGRVDFVDFINAPVTPGKR